MGTTYFMIFIITFVVVVIVAILVKHNKAESRKKELTGWNFPRI